jgi:hypothetical protein
MRIIRNRLLAGIFSILVIAAGTNSSRAQLSASQTWGGTSGGTANAQTLAIPNVSSVGQLVGVPIRFLAGFTNTSAATITVNSLAPLPVRSPTPSGAMALQGGEIKAGNPEEAWTDGTYFYVTVFNGLLPGTPVPLLAPQTYYVNSSTGLDSNACTTSGAPCLTIGHAIALTQALNLNGYNVTINVSNGTYPPYVCGPINGSGNVFIVGNNTTPSSALVSAATGPAIFVTGSGYTLSGMAMTSAANGSGVNFSTDITVGGGVTVSIYNMSFGSAAFALMLSQYGASLDMIGATEGFPLNFINVTGPSPVGMYVVAGASISPGGSLLNVTGTPAFSLEFAFASQNAEITTAFGTVTGTATGVKCNSTLNGVITGTSNYPGSSACTTATGGQFN